VGPPSSVIAPLIQNNYLGNGHSILALSNWDVGVWRVMGYNGLWSLSDYRTKAVARRSPPYEPTIIKPIKYTTRIFNEPFIVI